MQPAGKALRITGWVLSGLLAEMLLSNAAFKLTSAEMAVEGFKKFGPEGWLLIIGVGELVSTLLFLIPRSAVLGVFLLSAYLGGAIVTHMQHDEPILVPSVLLVVLWVAAGLRMPYLFQTLLGTGPDQATHSSGGV